MLFLPVIACTSFSTALRAFVTLRSHTTDAEVGVPSLFAHLEFTISYIARVVDNLLRSSCSTTSWLVNEEHRVAFLQEYIAPSLSSVGSRLPTCPCLSVAVQKGYGITITACWNLIERIGMIYVCRRALALWVEPVLCRVILTRNGIRHPSARREHALLLNHQALRLLFCLTRAGHNGDGCYSQCAEKITLSHIAYMF